MVCIERNDNLSKLDEYIASKYKNSSKWFVEEVGKISNQERVQEVKEIRDYLDGNHKIKNKPNYKYNGEVFEPKKIVLSTASTLLDFQRQHLLHHPVTLTGNEKVTAEVGRISKAGKYERLNRKILHKVLTDGEVYEYVYRDGSKIKSKLIDAMSGHPVYNRENELVALIEHYVYDNVSYYNVFKDTVVEQYRVDGRKVEGIARYANLSGLPIVYKSENEVSKVKGRSQLKSWIPLLDAQEDLLSKYSDAILKFIAPIPVISGNQLKQQGLPSEIIGAGLLLDDGGELNMVGNKLDYQSFTTVYNGLTEALLDISCTPSIAMNKSSVANVSESSIKLLFSLSNTRASLNQQFMEDGFEQRFQRFRELLKYDGVTFTDDEYDTLDVEFTYNIPSNNNDILVNLKALRELGAISMESLLEKAPYINDVAVEAQRLQREGNSVTDADTKDKDAVVVSDDDKDKQED